MSLHEIEQFWKGDQGNAYTDRQTLTVHERRIMFERILRKLNPLPQSIIEFGANVGDNLQAIREVIPTAHLTGVEVNEQAFRELKIVANLAFHGSMLDFPSAGQWQMSLTRGVLIHIHPDNLQIAYETLYHTATHYICVCEYFSPKPRMIPYRGQDNLLWARDFAGELLDQYRDLKLRDYGFIYDRDLVAPQDNVTWFVLEKVKE